MKKGFSGCLVILVQIFILLMIVGAISSYMGDSAGGLALIAGIVWLFVHHSKSKNKELSESESDDTATIATISFSYKDAKGNFTTRTVDVYYVDDVYISGYCHKQYDNRTFRADRIVSDITMNGKLYSVDDWLEMHESTALSKSNPKIISSLNLEVCFSGFRKDDKETLEQYAINNGFTVCSSVTKNLTFLVIGSHAGSKIMEQANEVGASVISETEFLEMIETGEIPR